ncbi:MAG: hypothetical protein AAB393_02235 [Bacteroidota bacterium]
MSSDRSTRQKALLRYIVLSTLYLLSTAIILFIFLNHPGIGHSSSGSAATAFEDHVYGTAQKPFVYRALMPFVIRSSMAALSEETKTGIRELAEQKKKYFAGLDWNMEYIVEYLVAVKIMFLCLLGFLVVLRLLLKFFYPSLPAILIDFVPLAALWLLPLLFRYYHYIYDPATLLLFTLAVYLITMRRLGLFYLVFALATINKETAILLIGVFALHELTLPSRTRLIAHIVAQLTIWGAIKGILASMFATNPGVFVEFHLLDHNLVPHTDPFAWLYFAAVVAAMWLLVRHRWSEKPVFLRRSLFVVAVPLLVLSFFFGYFDELRGYYEAYPIVFLLCVPTVVDVFGLDTSRVFASSETKVAS